MAQNECEMVTMVPALRIVAACLLRKPKVSMTKKTWSCRSTFLRYFGSRASLIAFASAVAAAVGTSNFVHRSFGWKTMVRKMDLCKTSVEVVDKMSSSFV